jgi:hypothetical protein
MCKIFDLSCGRNYKKQIEEAEEIAALNLAKFRQTQTALASAAEAAGQAEQALARAKAQAGGRAASIGPVSKAFFMRLVYLKGPGSRTANEGPVRIQYKCLVPIYVMYTQK